MRMLSGILSPPPTEAIACKADLINWVGWQRQAHRYLEIVTPTTGLQFDRISSKVFSTIHRAMYRLPPGFEDGMPMSFRTESDTSRVLLEPLLERSDRYDVIFVDPFHTYECSRLDLELALSLLASGGTMVVHDCCPTQRDLTTPQFVPGEWLGHTYLAFLDLMRERPELDYLVVDIDYGCGIVRFRPEGCADRSSRKLLDSIDYHDWSLYHAFYKDLLHLVEAETFIASHRLRTASLTAFALRAFRALSIWRRTLAEST
jgi:hypothetical protein